MVNNPLVQSPIDINEETTADRIGVRICNIRIIKRTS